MEEHETYKLHANKQDSSSSHPEKPAHIMNANLMLCIVLSVLGGAITAPLEDMSGSGELMNITESYNTSVEQNTTESTPTQEPAAVIAQSEQLTASGFNCSVPSEGPEHASTVSDLRQGLKNFRRYSFGVQQSTKKYVDNQNDCYLASITDTIFSDVTPPTVWQSMAVLQSYADLATVALDESAIGELQEEQQTQMQTIIDNIATILSDYKTVLANQHCECDTTMATTPTCLPVFVTLPPLPSTCKPYFYVAKYLRIEVQRAFIILRNKLASQ